MDKKHKVWNKNKYDVGIKLMNGIEVNIRPGSFYSADEDNIYYLNTTCSLFKDLTLTIDDKELCADLGISTQDFNVITDKEIKEYLNGSFSNMKSRFDLIDKQNVKFKIFDMAKSMYEDLSGKQLNYLSQLCGREVEDFVDKNKKDDNTENTIQTKNASENKEDIIKTLLAGNFLKMKSELTKYAEDKELVYELAKTMIDGMPGGKVKYISEFCGKSLIE